MNERHEANTDFDLDLELKKDLEDDFKDFIQVGQVYQKRITLSLIKFSIPVLYAEAYRQFINDSSLPLNETSKANSLVTHDV